MYGPYSTPFEEGTISMTLATLTTSDSIEMIIAVFSTFLRGGLFLRNAATVTVIMTAHMRSQRR